jgi:hypothetical protein
MALDHRDLTTHPRFNHRLGPNGTAKKEVIIRDGLGTPQHYTLSRDTDMIRHRQIGHWLVSRIGKDQHEEEGSSDKGRGGIFKTSTLPRSIEVLYHCRVC